MDSEVATTSAQSKGKKRKDPKDFNIPWIINEIKETPAKKVLKLVKPARGGSEIATELEISNASTVVPKRHEVSDHAFHIMHQLWHKNILCMKALVQDETNDDHVTAYVEPTTGLLSSICPLKACCDDLGHIPSQFFRDIVRQIFDGIEFLRGNGLYHGNLNWETTLFLHPSTVKLSEFKHQDLSVNDAQFHDRSCLAMMLQIISTAAQASNGHGGNYLCNHIDGLIAVLLQSNASSQDILDSIFFWGTRRRGDFFATIVSLKMKDAKFKSMIRHSHICGPSWNNKSDPRFATLVKHMDDFRDTKS